MDPLITEVGDGFQVCLTNICCYEPLHFLWLCLSNRCIFKMQYFHYFVSLPVFSSSNEIGSCLLLSKCTFLIHTRFCNVLQQRKNRVPALISGLHKLPKALDLCFYFRFRYPNAKFKSLLFWVFDYKIKT